MSSETVYLLAPEIVLVLLATLIYLGGAFLPARRGWSWLSAGAIVLAAVALYAQAASPTVRAWLAEGNASGPLLIDHFSLAMRFGALGVGLVFVMLASRWSEWGESSEFMGSLLLIVVGMMLLALSGDLVMLFVSLELISIPTYVLLYLGRRAGMLEAGTKYFFLSILSSALLLYGFSFLYGATGSTSLDAIERGLNAAGAGSMGLAFSRLALVFIFAGLCFRLTAVPFHFYAPDVYQGTTHPNAGILAVVPKFAALVALARIALAAMPGLEQLGWQLSLALAMVTMTLGNLLALWQSNVRRLMAYSSVAHAGYMLIGLAVGFAVAGGAAEAGNLDGLGASLFYVLVYAGATAGTFAALAYLSSSRRQLDTVEELAGLSQNYPKTAAAIALFMFSLTGLPPLAGFWGKFALFTGALGVDARNPEDSSLWPWFLALAIVGGLNAAISAAYYLRIVGVMYFRPATNRVEARGGAGPAWATAVCAALVLVIGFYPGPWVEQSNLASRAARGVPLEPAETSAAQPVVRPIATTARPQSPR